MKQNCRAVLGKKIGAASALCAFAVANFCGIGVSALAGNGPVNDAYPSDSLATIQGYVNQGGTVNFHPGTYDLEGSWLEITRAVDLVGPEVEGTFDTQSGADSRTWSAMLENGYIFISCIGENATDTVRIRNLSVINRGVQYVIHAPPWGDFPYTVAILHNGIGWYEEGGNLEISDCYIESEKMAEVDQGTYGFWSLKTGGVPGSDPEVLSIRRCHLKVIGLTGGDNDPLKVVSSRYEIFEAVENIIEATAGSDWCTGIDMRFGAIGDSILIRDNHITSIGFGIGIWDTPAFVAVEYNILKTDGSRFGCITIRHPNIDPLPGGIISGNDVEVKDGEAMSLLRTSNYVIYDNVLTGAMILKVVDNSHFEGNRFRDVNGDPLAAVILLTGENNSFVRNDYRDSGVAGWNSDGSGGPGCVLLAPLSDKWPPPVNNLVKENGGFPRGTNAKTQVLDLGVNNRVVGHPANHVLAPGIGQRIQELRQAIEDAEAEMEANELFN
ncbi:MAG: hypothetical protein DRP71_13225 [Verrucomicrobia bacterium]|nr:MAG: hypothetical protein DRP71_13225 [Verrucomicrobiota bacterium]